MANVAAFLVLLLAIPTAYAAQHIVGDSSGWTNGGVNYDDWSSGQTFTVDDTLLFNYGSSHQVAEVTKSDYDNCASSNAIQTYSNGPTTIKLSKAGTMYFICPTLGHCGSGMKLSVNVVAAGSNTPSGSPTTPSTPSAPTTPSTNTPTTTTPTTTNSPANNAASSTWGMRNVLGLLLVAGASVALMG